MSPTSQQKSLAYMLYQTCSLGSSVELDSGLFQNALQFSDSINRYFCNRLSWLIWRLHNYKWHRWYKRTTWKIKPCSMRTGQSQLSRLHALGGVIWHLLLEMLLTAVNTMSYSRKLSVISWQDHMMLTGVTIFVSRSRLGQVIRLQRAK